MNRGLEIDPEILFIYREEFNKGILTREERHILSGRVRMINYLMYFGNVGAVKLGMASKLFLHYLVIEYIERSNA